MGAIWSGPTVNWSHHGEPPIHHGSFPWHGIRQLPRWRKVRWSWDPNGDPHGRYDIRPNFKNYPHSNLLPEFFTEILERPACRGSNGAPWFASFLDCLSVCYKTSFCLFIRMFFWGKGSSLFSAQIHYIPSRGSSPSLVEDASIFSWNSHMHPQNMKT